MSKKPTCNLEFVREDDYVEYFIFPQLPDNLAGGGVLQQQEIREHLKAMIIKCNEIVAQHVNEREYIWHKDTFLLQARTGSTQECLLDDEHDTQNENDATTLQQQKGTLPPHLHGITHYGDNIADEWFIVYLLCKLTQQIPNCIARVIDSDGEFLLIEAADVLPNWANPDTCEQRVYIVEGHLQLVQNSPSNTSTIIPVATALSKIRCNPTLYRVSNEIQSCINERVKEFKKPTPDSNSSIHRQIVRLPLGVAALLKENPSLIAPAIHAFCERDSMDMKVCKVMRLFPPEQRVRTNVRFTRCLYAMVMHSNYAPDRKIGWNLSSETNTESYKEDLLGVKIACGFEILASQAKDANTQDNEPAWRAYVKSLTDKGYFRENLDGSKEYKELLEQARQYYTKNNERFRTAPLVGREILNLLQQIEINADQFRDEEENNLRPSDSDDWLNITAEQLDAMLNERLGTKKLYKANGDINAEEFTKNLAEFLEKKSDFDGIGDIDSDDDSEPNNSDKQAKEANRAKVKKNRSMRKACNEQPIASNKQSATIDTDNFTTHVRNFLDFVIPEDKWDSNSDMSDYEDEDDLERNIEAMTNSELNIDSDIQAYMAQMDKELARTTIGQSFERKQQQKKNNTGASIEDDFDDIESFEPININVNTLKNMMDSYKSQLGGAGPVSNLLNAMGVGMSSSSSNQTDKTKDLSESSV